MEKIGRVIDNKFDEALEMMLENGMNSVLTSLPVIGSPSEVIGLDCGIGDPNRYIVTRPCLDGQSVGFDIGNPELGEINCTSWLVQIPRTLGDKRRMEDLSDGAFDGDLLLVDGEKEIVINMSLLEMLGNRAVRACSFELSGLRVAERITLPEL